ncbi:amino acid permease [Streptosporangium sp. CA-115845]|uniref:amino acid permease n=1 Tax=Streptosporangium sp. CA-115845 TaxID=3240071 RepID=UPI003D8A6648
MPDAVTGTQGSLRARHTSMLAIGGIIGAGLFVGSGSVIHSAGALAVAAYAIGGIILLLMMRMLAEMAAVRPTLGSFSEYARLAFGRWAGFSIGWTYWYFWIVVVAFEAVAGAEIISHVVPSVPLWIISAVIMAVMTAVNLLSVRAFGEAEFWFASIKVIAIIVFLALGVLGLLDLLPSQQIHGIALRTDSIAPSGLAGLLSALVVVVFSYFGAEIVTIAAAEAENPVQTVVRASKAVVWRVIIFYVGTISLIVLLLPWKDTPSDASPFVALLQKLGIPGASVAMQAIILVSVLSVLNAGIYTSSRMLCALTAQGEAPRMFSKRTRRGTPARAILLATLVGWLAVGMAYVAPDTVFSFLLNAAGSVALVIYFVIAASQLRLRRVLDRAGEHLPVRMWAYPYLTWVTLLLLSGIVATMLALPATRSQLVIGLIAPVAFVVVYFIRGALRMVRGRASDLLPLK